MATQIEIFAEEARRIFYGGDPPDSAGWRLSEAKILAKQALSEVAKSDFYESYKVSNQHKADDRYLVSYQVNLTLDTARNLKYAILPESYLAIPNNKGVDTVSYDKDQKTITKVDNGVFKRASGGTRNEMVDEYYYIVEAGKILIKGACIEDLVRLTNVWITLAVANEITATQANGFMVVMKTIQLYTATKPRKDNIPDNLDTPTHQ